ncbi:MAG: 2',3'-cyclic-nucleotide 2'-phosphodiesterase, partial [Enterobacteriaceae bacterium]
VNNYRAYTGAFPGTGEDKVAFASPDEVRAIVANYIEKVTADKGELQPIVYNKWRLAPVISKQPLDIRIETSPSEQAQQFIKQHALYPMTFIETDKGGFGIYRVQLDQR